MTSNLTFSMLKLPCHFYTTRFTKQINQLPSHWMDKQIISAESDIIDLTFKVWIFAFSSPSSSQWVFWIVVDVVVKCLILVKASSMYFCFIPWLYEIPSVLSHSWFLKSFYVSWKMAVINECLNRTTKWFHWTGKLILLVCFFVEFIIVGR